MKELILIILALDVITEIFYIRRLSKERYSAEERATTHFKRANKFEQQLQEKMKENNEQLEILLNNSSELRAKIVDLENNIELLVNNLSDKNKELISDDQSEN